MTLEFLQFFFEEFQENSKATWRNYIRVLVADGFGFQVLILDLKSKSLMDSNGYAFCCQPKLPVL